MNCANWEERIALHAGGDLAEAEAAEVERHLTACAACREFEAGLQASLGLLRDAHGEDIAPAHFTAVRARVLAELGRRRAPWRWVWAGVGTAAAAIVVIALALWPRPAPPPRVVWHRPPVPAQALAVAAARVRKPVPHRRRVIAVGRPEHHAAPLVVKLLTNDPNVVIYWIADQGDE